MDIAADELIEELDRLDTTLALVVRRAGDGGGPELERRLQAHLRRLRSMLCGDGIAVAEDTIDAALRVLVSAEPEAPLLVLGMARGTLEAILRRQAANSVRAAA